MDICVTQSRESKRIAGLSNMRMTRFSPNVAAIAFVGSVFWVAFSFLIRPGLAQAQVYQFPASGWTETKIWGGTGTGDYQFLRVWSFAAGEDGSLIVHDCCNADSNNEVRIYSPSGLFVSKYFLNLGSQFAARSVNEIYEGRSNLIKKNSTGQLIRSLSPNGSGEGQVLDVASMEFDLQGRLFVWDRTRAKVLVFSSADEFLYEWGEFGTSPGQISHSGSGGQIAIDITGRVWLGRQNISRFDIFSPEGAFLKSLPQGTSVPQVVRVGPLLAKLGAGAAGVTSPYVSRVRFNDLSGQEVGFVGAFPGTGPIDAMPDGRIIVSVGTTFYEYYPGYLSPYSAVVRAYPPIPAVVNVVARSGSTIIDLDFHVYDIDSAAAETGLVFFKHGVRDLTSLVLPISFVEGTEASLGVGTPTGTNLRVSWDAAADLIGAGVQSGRFEVLANDGRGVVDLAFVTLPAGLPNAPDPELTISRFPVSEDALLQAWFWLLATGDSDIMLVDGEVIGLSVGYDGVVLATGNMSTESGRAFLFERLGVRLATPAEIDRAKEGATPGVQQFVPLKRVGNIPVLVNEIGADTGATGGYWVVKL